jgi:hypothetical protein
MESADLLWRKKFKLIIVGMQNIENMFIKEKLFQGAFTTKKYERFFTKSMLL